jgi:hypothetical protein
MNDDNPQEIRKLFTLENPANNEILLSVEPIAYGCFGVYADFQLIAILRDRAAAHAHCQRLIRRQVEGVT